MAVATIEEGLVTFLLADAAITALVGTRIGPWGAQGEDTPRISWTLISTEDESMVRLSSDEPSVRIQIDCWASGMAGARALAKLVKNSRGGQASSVPRLKEYQGNMGGAWVQSCRMENELTEATDPFDASETPLCRVIQDYIIGFKEP